MINAKRLLKNQLPAGELVEKLLVLSQNQQICLLDSSGVSHLESHFLICGAGPLETFEVNDEDPEKTLEFLDRKLALPDSFAIFTISYDFGLKLEKIKPVEKRFFHDEPDVFLALFDFLLIHDYKTGETYLTGNENRFDEFEARLFKAAPPIDFAGSGAFQGSQVTSNFTKAEYLEKIDEIKEHIRRGDTYQTNLTQQFSAALPENLTPPQIFHKLRKNNPAPFASFIQRNDSTVISASPERFFKAARENPENLPLSALDFQTITTSPIKGTRPRGKNAGEDEKLKKELLASDKDRAENVMIVDLLRNDLGRICEFGTVRVEILCDLEEHPTLFHLVSTVSGELRPEIKFSEMIRAVFPCGSITGAPKIRTMRIIDRLETATRGLSMGAIGFSSPPSAEASLPALDLSVAIRTMTVKGAHATFNVGGGIVIDSFPEDEYEETLTKAKALLDSIDGELKT